jgi:hypothetical protein
MNAPIDRNNLAGAARFIAELSAVAHDCAATGAWTDELSDRRRRRALGPPPVAAQVRGREGREKAL